LAVDANGYVYAWGRASEGQLGYGGTATYKLTVVDVNDVNDIGPLEGIISVSAGEWHSMALEGYDPSDPNLQGRVYTWGDDTFEVGQGSGVLGIGYVREWLSETPIVVLSGGGIEEDVWLGAGGGEFDCVVLVKGVDCLAKGGEEAGRGLVRGAIWEWRRRLQKRGRLFVCSKREGGRQGINVFGGRGVLKKSWKNVKIRIYHVLG